MTRTAKITYLFDPLCGWCYAAAPTIRQLSQTPGFVINMQPTGLFVSPRPVATIADHARANDGRIQELTGQPFTEAYHDGVMQAPGGVFSSMALTRALVALGQIDPALEPRFLNAAQTARYVEGKDTSRPDIVAGIAKRIAGDTQDEASLRAAIESDPALAAATEQRIIEGQTSMQSLGLRGVPQLVVQNHLGAHLVDSQTLYAGRDAVLNRLREIA